VKYRAATTPNLSDAAKVKAEYGTDGPKSEFPPGHMADFAQALSCMRQNTLDQDAKLFFVLGNALLDSSISAWASKYEYDFWRPTTAIRVRYKDKLVTSWLGPKKGYGKVLGQNWMRISRSTSSLRRSLSTCPGTAPSAPPAARSWLPSTGPKLRGQGDDQGGHGTCQRF
jgi:hypothetical protein